MNLTFTYLDPDDVTVVEDTDDILLSPNHAGVVRTLVDENRAALSTLFLPWPRVLSIESVDGPAMMNFS